MPLSIISKVNDDNCKYVVCKVNPLAPGSFVAIKHSQLFVADDGKISADWLRG